MRPSSNRDEGRRKEGWASTLEGDRKAYNTITRYVVAGNDTEDSRGVAERFPVVL